MRNQNFIYLLSKLRKDIYFTNFRSDGCSNYAHLVILKPTAIHLCEKLMSIMDSAEIEYRRGTAGGGNQLRQPYLRSLFKEEYHLNFPNTEYVHFFGFYIGNYPSMNESELDIVASFLNSVGE